MNKPLLVSYPDEMPCQYYGREGFAPAAGVILLPSIADKRLLYLYPTFSDPPRAANCCMIEIPVSSAIELSLAILRTYAPHLLSQP